MLRISPDLDDRSAPRPVDLQGDQQDHPCGQCQGQEVECSGSNAEPFYRSFSLSSSTLSVFSQEKDSRPKWPYEAVSW